jgi:surfactin synthase thioesterase subunit
MKKIFLTASIAIAMIACSGPSEKQEETISAEQEAEIVEKITSDLNQAQEELKTQTEEGINEIDSLLSDF